MPISLDDYKRILRTSVPQFRDYWLNGPQETSAFASHERPLFIVAGPGTGKTTVLAVRILYLIFVEGFAPESILATTFTRKAANELRSRILSWGNSIRNQIIAEHAQEEPIMNWINSVDVNLVLTGTLDAIAEDAIENDRQPTEITPVIIEKQLANGFMRQNVLFQNDLYNNNDLKQAIASLCGIPLAEVIVPTMIASLTGLSDRLIQDLVDVDALSDSSPENRCLINALQQYWAYLEENHLMDFALLEREFLRRLQNGRLDAIRQLSAVFVDEFQDTNPLQEEIYYSLCEQSGASLTVVGDDDQSIYRFRGATVEIFSQLINRIVGRLGAEWEPIRVDLVHNYRSTAKIVDFSNVFIHLDSNFQNARTPDKQIIVPINPGAVGYDQNLPILGMFRENITDLATDLADFLQNIFEGGGYSFSIGQDGTTTRLLRGENGDWGDAVLLTYTANDFTVSSHGNAPRERLPRILRRELESRGVSVFNPRGRSIIDIPEVRVCLGLILLCIDNDEHILQSTYPPSKRWAQGAVAEMRRWRSAAIDFINDPSTPMREDLEQFVDDWANKRTSDGQRWPSEWPLVELLFTLMKWIPLFRDDPEGQIYLEVIARAITTAGRLSKYSGNILFDIRYHHYTVRDILQEVMLPIANGEIEVDEEIMPNVPRSYFPIMTIHQAKGLEFPLVIVDVGSDFKTDHPKQRRTRYPENGNSTHIIENRLAPFSQIGPLRLQRTDLERAFDDLRRLYFVANTRAQSILLLIGLNKTIANNNIKLVQSGYVSTDTSCHLNYQPHEHWTGNEQADTIMLI